MLSIDSVFADFLKQYSAEHLYIAYSGGMDSSVLLHAAAKVFPQKQIAAIHVHHGLQAQADAWVDHCRKICQHLRIQCQIHYANVSNETGESLEALARDARYQYFESLLNNNADCLLTAHHADDQAETFLLNALRGSGVAGLAAMPEVKALGKGRHLRPFLGVTRQQLLEYAKKHQLTWIEDPSNRDDSFNRNYLRNQVIPLLQSRWPQMSTTLSRSATLCGDAAELSQQLAESDCQQSINDDPHKIAIEPLISLTPNRRLNVLRFWLQALVSKMPSKAVMEQLDAMLFSNDDTNPEVKLGSRVIRRFQGYLHNCDAHLPSLQSHYLWPVEQALRIEGLGTYLVSDLGEWAESLCLENAVLDVRFRQGGERIQLSGREHQHQVKKLLQEQFVPPWLRDRLPFIFYQNRLIAVLGLNTPIIAAM